MRFWIVASAVLAGWAVPALADGVVTPSNLRVAGTITVSASSSSGPTLASGNSVYALVKSSGAIAATGSILDSDGTYLIDMSKDQSFNGTDIVFRLSNNGSTYKLMESSSTEASATYTGGFPFPSTLYKDMIVGAVTSSPSTGGGSGSSSGGTGDCGGTTDFDANGDGVSNQADIDYIKTQMGASSPDSAADINGDGRVTVIDAILSIKAAAGAMRGLSSCPAASMTTTTDTTSSSTTTDTTTSTSTTTTE